MMGTAKTRAESADDELLREIRARFERAWNAEREARAEALEDLQFRAGEQWPDPVLQERRAASRPTLTINRMPQFVRQVTGEIRQNRPAVKVRPVDSRTDPALAATVGGLIRHIEQASDAQGAYVCAAESAAVCGIGHFRIVTDYASDDSFEQDIRIRRMANPFAVWWDPEAREITREDARWCFVTERIPLAEFRERWPKARRQDFDAPAPEAGAARWWDGECMRVAEYWVKRPTVRILALLEGGASVDVTDIGESARAALPVLRTRKVETHRVLRYLVSGAEVLEGPDEWAGRHIPIVPVIGEEVHVGDRTIRHGIVRYAKDPQRLYNYWRTTAAESVALAPKAPWLVTPRQIEGQKAAWQEANRGNPAFLPYNPDPSAPPPQRIAPAYPPVALFQEAGIAADDMKAVTGIYDASLGARGNETSGRAILARQREGDTGTFVYIDNLARAIRHAGRILVDLIPRIYDTERTLRILGEDGEESFVAINATMPGVEGPALVNDLSAGKYDVEVATGPSFATRRIEAAESMMAFVAAVPQAGAVIADLIARNMDWPGAEQIAARLRGLLPPGIDEEAGSAESRFTPPPPDPAALVSAAKAEVEIAKTAAQADKAAAEAEGQRLENARTVMTLTEGDGG